jgi:hypothetical protein
MLIAYRERGVVLIRDMPHEETRVPRHTCETEAAARGVLDEAERLIHNVHWEVVPNEDKSKYSVQEKR